MLHASLYNTWAYLDDMERVELEDLDRDIRDLTDQLNQLRWQRRQILTRARVRQLRSNRDQEPQSSLPT